MAILNNLNDSQQTTEHEISDKMSKIDLIKNHITRETGSFMCKTLKTKPIKRKKRHFYSNIAT